MRFGFNQLHKQLFPHATIQELVEKVAELYIKQWKIKSKLCGCLKSNTNGSLSPLKSKSTAQGQLDFKQVVFGSLYRSKVNSPKKHQGGSKSPSQMQHIG